MSTLKCSASSCIEYEDTLTTGNKTTMANGKIKIKSAHKPLQQGF